MIIDVDIGNTRVKWRPAGDSAFHYFSVGDEFPVPWQASPKDTRFRISSVLGAAETLQFCERLRSLGVSLIELAVVKDSHGGLSLAYENATSFGVDRWLALLAAHARHPGVDCIVIHAGTALVADLLRADGRHVGGYIVAGWQTALHSLGHAAPVLAESTDAAADSLRADPGTTTLECIERGMALLFSGFMRELALSASRSLNSPVWLFAGGDAEKMLRTYSRVQSAFAADDCMRAKLDLVPELVLDGLAIALP